MGGVLDAEVGGGGGGGRGKSPRKRKGPQNVSYSYLLGGSSMDFNDL